MTKKDAGLLPYAKAHAGEIDALLRDNRVLLERYRLLRTYPRFAESVEYGFYSPLPRFAPLRSCQRATLLHLAAMANRGAVTEALAGLREDTEYWRFISRSSRTSISKLIAMAALSTDIRFAAELGASQPLAQKDLEAVREILKPFSTGEASVAGAIKGEARYTQRGLEVTIWRTMTRWSTQRVACKQNATDNLMWTAFQQLIRLAELPPRQLADQVKRGALRESATPRMGLSFLYNPTGEILARIALPTLTGQIERGHDLEGSRRLALLKVLSRQENVPPERMQPFLDAHAADLGNPYTGAPMKWDQAKRNISFPGLSRDKTIEMTM